MKLNKIIPVIQMILLALTILFLFVNVYLAILPLAVNLFIIFMQRICKMEIKFTTKRK